MKGTDTRACYVCGGTMKLSTSSTTINLLGKEIEIKGIQTYRCAECGEEVYTSQEAEMVERIAQAMTLPYKLYLETPLDTHNSIWARFFVDLLTSYFDKNVFCTDFTEKYFFEDIFPKQYKSFLNKSKELFDTEEARLINKVTLMIQMAKLAYPNNENAEAIELLNTVLQDVEMLHNFAPAAPDQVVLMTYHKSKGLEFDIVFNMDVYEYIMPPFKRSEQTDKEYRTDYIQTLNLHYVGITRAKQVCYIMQGTVRHNANGEVKRGTPSQFLNLNGVNNMRNNVGW